RQRANSDEEEEFYDITAWSMPLAMNLDAYVAPAPIGGAQVSDYVAPAVPAFRSAAYGYIVDALEPHFYELVGRLLKNEVKFSVFDEDSDAGARKYDRGSIIILKGNNSA